MIKYSIYSSYSNYLQTFYRPYKNKIPYVKDMLKLTGMPLINRFLAVGLAADASTAMLFRMLYGEQARKENGNPAIFLKDSDISRLTKGIYQLDTIPDDLFPFEAFTVCFPSSFEVNGKKLPGVQVSFVNDKPTFISRTKTLIKQLPNSNFFSSEHEMDYAFNTQELTIAYLEPGDNEHTYLTYRSENLLRVLNSATFEAFQRNAFSIDPMGTNISALSESELERQYVILRAILGMCVYLKARPEALKDGFPDVKNFSLSEPFGVPTNSFSFDAGHQLGFGASPKEHYRSWHIRQLNHPRYYQGEHKDKAPGSRLVFVSDTMVNSSATVKSIGE